MTDKEKFIVEKKHSSAATFVVNGGPETAQNEITENSKKN